MRRVAAGMVRWGAVCLVLCIAPAESSGLRAEIYSTAFSTDPELDGWTLGPSWEWGEATPSACGGGGSDPAEDHSAGGDDLLVGFELGAVTRPGWRRAR